MSKGGELPPGWERKAKGIALQQGERATARWER